MKLIEALGVTYAAIGQEITDAGLEIVAGDLKDYALEDVLRSLSRCRKELRRISLKDILDRLPNQHLGPEEAWALIAPSLGNERLTLCWTDPIRLAAAVAFNLESDPIAARMAFKEAYQREVAEARERGEAPQWSISPGHDGASRASVIAYNVKLGRLPTTALMQLTDQVDEVETRKPLAVEMKRLAI